jgi:hypothetical protein
MATASSVPDFTNNIDLASSLLGAKLLFATDGKDSFTCTTKGKQNANQHCNPHRLSILCIVHWLACALL